VNEIAVAAFLAEQISFLAIPEVISKVMGICSDKAIECLQDVLNADQWAREQGDIVLIEFKQQFSAHNKNQSQYQKVEPI
jgi:1-deoxy-D-xylulose-5-phosphate reductoisomerase